MHQWGSYEVILFTPFRRKTCLLKAKFSDVPADPEIFCRNGYCMSLPVKLRFSHSVTLLVETFSLMGIS